VSWPVWAALVAAVPIVLLAVLVLRSQPLTRSAWLVAGVAALLALLVFGLDLTELGVAAIRGCGPVAGSC
jgi:L-lactate permease